MVFEGAERGKICRGRFLPCDGDVMRHAIGVVVFMRFARGDPVEEITDLSEVLDSGDVAWVVDETE